MRSSTFLSRQRSRHRARLRLGRCSASYQRDAQGRITSTDTSYGRTDSKAGSTPLTFHTEQGHNADGQPASLTYPDGSQQSYAYTNGQLNTIATPRRRSHHV